VLDTRYDTPFRTVSGGPPKTASMCVLDDSSVAKGRKGGVFWTSHHCRHLRGGARENNYFTEMCSGSEEGSYLRLIDLCITQL